MSPSLSRLIALGCLGALCLSCAPSATLTKARNLSTSGVAYSDAVDSLITTTIDTLIEDDNNRLLAQADAFSLPDDPAQQKQVLTGFLDTSDQSLQTLLGELNGFRGRVRVLKSYFTGLQALADADEQTNASTALGGLSDAINSFNTVLKKKSGLVITPAEQSAVSQLAGLVAQQAQSHVVHDALLRDAPIIGEYLLLQKKFVAQVADILKDSYTRGINEERQNQVLNPYINKDITDDQSWKAARKRVLTSAFFSQALDNVESASTQLSDIWRGILKGENDIGSIEGVLGDITQFTNALEAVKSAAKSSRPEPPTQAAEDNP